MKFIFKSTQNHQLLVRYQSISHLKCLVQSLCPHIVIVYGTARFASSHQQQENCMLDYYHILSSGWMNGKSLIILVRNDKMKKNSVKKISKDLSTVSNSSLKERVLSLVITK